MQGYKIRLIGWAYSSQEGKVKGVVGQVTQNGEVEERGGTEWQRGHFILVFQMFVCVLLKVYDQISSFSTKDRKGI